MEEIEAKFLGINPEKIEEKLSELDAKDMGEEILYAISFDYPGFPLDEQAAWVRLRNIGGKTMLAYKQRLGVKADGGNDAGMKEIETEVGDFDMTREFLLAIGMIEKFANEKKRRSWVRGDIHYDLDTWPRLDPYLEIEAPNWEALDAAAKELGLDPEAKKICSATQIYKEAGINDKDFIKMTFSEWVPRD